MEKVVRNGKVAVFYSPGYGAGWSTWSNGDASKIMVFHPSIVSAKETGATEDQVEALIKNICPDEYAYFGGWNQVVIKWLDEGTVFEIQEYDGNESIRIIGDGNEFLVA